VIAAVINSALVVAAQTAGGAIGDAIAYLWLIVYVAIFFPAVSTPFAALIAAGFGLGLLGSGLPSMVAAWALICITTAVLAGVLSRVSRAVRGHLGTDALTGAMNRGGLEAAAAEALLHARRRDEQLTVAALDLDAFKQVNDEEGHAGGDRLLAEAVAAWRSALRSEDVLARTGGDEFVLIMPGTSPAPPAGRLSYSRTAALDSAGSNRSQLGQRSPSTGSPSDAPSSQ
jgi:GGDEF domain-containing protein